MALSDTKIHQIELLLTLDYLLNHTDEFNPATQIDICEHGRKYGLKFDKNAKKGNQVRRQRIGECLKFLKQISDDFPDDVPFVLETTDSGKYYIEQRNGLNENQVAKILAAITNDKYTKDEDAAFLSDRILGAFSSGGENRDIIEREYKTLVWGGKKYDKETLRKISLVEKAFREGKMIKIKFSVNDPKNGVVVDYFFWYRVYLIKELHNKLHAFMLPIGQINPNAKTGRVLFEKGYLFEKIERIDVASEPEKDVLCDDMDENRDFDALFRQRCPKEAQKYGTIDNMLESTLLPNGGKACIVSFYFRLAFKDFLKSSFEDFFSEEFRYQQTNIIPGIENQIKGFQSLMDHWRIVTDEPKKSEPPKYGLANISVDLDSFTSWLLSDPHGDGRVCIADMVTIIKPSSINVTLARYFYSKLSERLSDLPEDLQTKLGEQLPTKKIVPSAEGDFYIENEITSQLDESLKTKGNCMIQGLSGFGKTATVKSWLKHNGDKVNGLCLSASSICHYPGCARQKDDLTLSGRIFSEEEIDHMASMPNLVVVIDDYQRINPAVKWHILLLCDHYVVDEREKSGFKKLGNLEFVCLIKTTEF